MNMRIAIRHAAGLIVAAVILSSCRSPMADAQMAEQMRQLADELNGLRQDMGLLHEQMDSLRSVVVRQDTIVRQLASMANVPMPPR
jgi:hypothetical protein